METRILHGETSAICVKVQSPRVPAVAVHEEVAAGAAIAEDGAVVFAATGADEEATEEVLVVASVEGTEAAVAAVAEAVR